jgi:hypothetical protein
MPICTPTSGRKKLYPVLNTLPELCDMNNEGWERRASLPESSKKDRETTQRGFRKLEKELSLYNGSQLSSCWQACQYGLSKDRYKMYKMYGRLYSPPLII